MGVIAGCVERRELRIDQRGRFERLLAEASAVPPRGYQPSLPMGTNMPFSIDDAFVERQHLEPGIARIARSPSTLPARISASQKAGVVVGHGVLEPAPLGVVARLESHGKFAGEIAHGGGDTQLRAGVACDMREPESRVGLRARVVQPFDVRHRALEERRAHSRRHASARRVHGFRSRAPTARGRRCRASRRRRASAGRSP